MRPAHRVPAVSLLLNDADYLAEIRERYEGGETLAVLGEAIGISPSWLGRVLKRNGCAMRPKGRSR